MGSEIGENKGEEPTATLDWDSIAEEELRSIEESYYASSNSKRKATSSSPILDLDLDLDPHRQQQRSKGRRLPNWAANSSADSVSYNRSWALSPPTCQLNSKLKYPRMIFGGRIVYCKTAIEAEQAALDLYDKIKARKQNEDQISCGFDIEWRPTFRQGEASRKAALMQICMDNSNCYIFHIIHSGIPPTLKSVLEDCSTVKVGVWIANDARKISRDYNVIVEPLSDLSEYANLKLGGPPKRWSLSSLTEVLTCKELAKPPKIRMGNWEASPLSREQLHYAATDAFASWYLYEVIKTFPDAKPENEDIEK